MPSFDQNMLNLLQCPITFEVLQDPINLPCCNNAVSRNALVQWHTTNKTCPLCRAALDHFNPTTAGTNHTIANLIDSIQEKGNAEQIIGIHKWSSTLTPITNDISYLNVMVEKSKFKCPESMFIAVVDNSGSMAGSPITQVKAALRHIIHTKSNIAMKLIVYESAAYTTELTEENINKLTGSGGTNFLNAYIEIEHLLKTHKHIKNFSIAFLTDGQDGSSTKKDALCNKFQESISEFVGHHDITVHTIGFGSGCDRVLLESMRQLGSIPGTFRYAEPSDDADTLSNKIMGVFSLSVNMMSVPITIKLLPNIMFFDDNSNEKTFKLNIDSKKWGVCSVFVKHPNNVKCQSVTINTAIDKNLNIECTPVDNKNAMDKFVSNLIDNVATKVLQLSKQPNDISIRNLVSTLYIKYLNSLPPVDIDRTQYLITQLKSWAATGVINENRVSDMRFTSLFAQKKEPGTEVVQITPKRTFVPVNQKPVKVYFEKALTCSMYTSGTQLIDIINVFSQTSSQVISPSIFEMLSTDARTKILEQNNYGVNGLMAAAYNGKFELVGYLLQFLTQRDVNIMDQLGETALTLAVKKRGYDFTIRKLIDAGAIIPAGRRTSILNYASSNSFIRTYNLLNCLESFESIYEIDDTMTPEFISSQYTKSKSLDNIPNIKDYFEIGLLKFMNEMIEDILKSYTPSIDQLYDYTIPPKPDHPETDKYLQLTNMLVTAYPTLLSCVNEEGDTPLHISAKKGSLPHVNYFLTKNVGVDIPNKKGTTALSMACVMQYPCIIKELLNAGANIEAENEKGVTPLYAVCMRGSAKVAELLISYGANMIHMTKCKNDTPILTCCRNGHDEVLSVLLNYVNKDFVNHMAPIDGFNAIMSCAEAGRKPNSLTGKTCIQVLYEYGIDLEQRTTKENNIISYATPLHIAAFYGRIYAVEELVHLGANINAVDGNGSTPLHISIIQGYTDVIKFLLKNGADITIADKSGNLPIDYCRNNLEIRNLLIDPIDDIMIDIIENVDDSAEYFKSTLTIFNEIKKMYWFGPIISNTELLITATILNRYSIVNLLLDVGVDSNSNKISPLFWALHNKNARLCELLKLYATGTTHNNALEQINTLANEVKFKKLVFLGKKPDGHTCKSTIISRMIHNINDFSDGTINNLPQLTFKNDILENSLVGKLKSLYSTRYMFDAKIQLIKKIVLNEMPPNIEPEMVLSLLLYTNNDVLCSMNYVNDPMAWNLIVSALQKFPYNYIGETFVGTTNIDRTKLSKGSVVTWNNVVSSSTSWRLAMEACPGFTSKSKNGTMLLFKSKTGKLMSSVSQYPFDSEVLFCPFTQFKVTNWYHGNVIALGQENIREYSYAVKEKDTEMLPINEMMVSDKSLIIELTEI